MSRPETALGAHVEYKQLNSRQQEIFNFQKVAALLADYGYACIKLSDDWKGADFLADHFSAEQTLRVQLKSCLTVDKKYIGKNIYMTFPVRGAWYLVPHEVLLDLVMQNSNVANTKIWQEKGLHFTASPSAKLMALLKPFALVSPPSAPMTQAKSAQSGQVRVRVGRDVVGPMAQNRAALTAITAAVDLAGVSMDDLRKIAGQAALRSVEGTHTGESVWVEFSRVHGMEQDKKSQWFIDSPIFRDSQTWLVQYNVWSRAKLGKLAEGLMSLTADQVEILIEE